MNLALAAFKDAVLDDKELMTQLLVPEHAEDLLKLAVELGAARGFHFSLDEARAMMQGGRRVWIQRWI